MPLLQVAEANRVILAKKLQTGFRSLCLTPQFLVHHLQFFQHAQLIHREQLRIGNRQSALVTETFPSGGIHGLHYRFINTEQPIHWHRFATLLGLKRLGLNQPCRVERTHGGLCRFPAPLHLRQKICNLLNRLSRFAFRIEEVGALPLR